MPERALTPRSVEAWFESPLGRSLQSYEVQCLRELLPRLYGTVALQLGAPGRLDLLEGAAAPLRIVHDRRSAPGGARVRGRPEELPYDGRSVDVVLLPHTLDFCDDPHRVLREALRVLKPEGHAVILGFNPLSLWGLRRLCTRQPRPAPWYGRFLRLARLKDWLGLLDFELTHGRMFYYRPPRARRAVNARPGVLDRMGDRWWPLMAAVYLVVARKRVPGVTPLPVAWKDRRLAGAALAEGAAARRTPAVLARGVVVPFVRRGTRPVG
jgi:SAM-dependent methyltransferase